MRLGVRRINDGDMLIEVRWAQWVIEWAMALNGFGGVLLAGKPFDALAFLAAVGSHLVDSHVIPQWLFGGVGFGSRRMAPLSHDRRWIK